MYKIEKKHYGLYVTMQSLYSADEMKTYLQEKDRMLAQFDGPFSIIVDLRSAIPPDKRDEQLLEENHAHLREHGLQRMAIVVDSPVVQMQAKQILSNAGIRDRTRIINAAKFPDWEERALNWVLYAIEPESSSESTHIYEGAV